MSKNNIFLSQEEINEIKKMRKSAQNEKDEIEKKAREKIFKDIKNNENRENERNLFNRQLDVLKASKEKPKNKSETKTYKSIIFNVYLDVENNYTRFIAMFDNKTDKSDLEEFTISGIFDNFKNSSFSKSYTIDINEDTIKDFIIIDGVKYEMYDPNNKKQSNELKKANINKSDDNSGSASTFWFDCLSFYNDKSYLHKKSGRKLKEEEINEIINVIQNSQFISDTDKFLYIQHIKSIKNFRMKDIRKTEEEIRGNETSLKIKDKA